MRLRWFSAKLRGKRKTLLFRNRSSSIQRSQQSMPEIAELCWVSGFNSTALGKVRKAKE